LPAVVDIASGVLVVLQHGACLGPEDLANDLNALFLQTQRALGRLVPFIESDFSASAVLAPYATRWTPDQAIAPRHMAQGSVDVTSSCVFPWADRS